MTTPLTLRETKGTPLTHAEMDENLTQLRDTADAKAQATAIGILATAENLGSFTGSTIADGATVKDALQALETAAESVTTTAATKANASALGVTASAADMGTFTGATIPDTQTAKQALQALETAFEAEPAATRTLTNKTINLSSNTMSGTLAQFNTAVSDADLASIAGSETLTNKTVNLTSNTLTGTLAQFNTAVSDADFVSIAGTETLTNKTLTTPTLTTPNINSASVPTVSGTAPLYMARAWVNFNGTGTVAIRASGNVTSITDGGVGVYTVNLTTALADANYSAVATCGYDAAGTSQYARLDLGSKTSSAQSLATLDATATNRDSNNVSVVIMR